MDKINELVYDQDIEIKAATISLLTRIVDLFPDEVKYNQLTQMFLDKMNTTFA